MPFIAPKSRWIDCPHGPSSVSSAVGGACDQPAAKYRYPLASYRVLNGLLPKFAGQWREMLSGEGLDPDDPERNPPSPGGSDSMAREAALGSWLQGERHRLGDEGGRQYCRQPYADYLGYQPVNTADSLPDPGRWQPDVMTRATESSRCRSSSPAVQGHSAVRARPIDRQECIEDVLQMRRIRGGRTRRRT